MTVRPNSAGHAHQGVHNAETGTAQSRSPSGNTAFPRWNTTPTLNAAPSRLDSTLEHSTIYLPLK